jgi:hypothetical protein
MNEWRDPPLRGGTGPPAKPNPRRVFVHPDSIKKERQ